MAEWNPWAELRSREHIVYELVSLPDVLGGGIYWPEGEWAAILVDRRLDRRTRRAVLAHELVHDERGGGCRHPDPVVITREERQVDDEVARRLVPLDQLRVFVDRCLDMGTGVEIHEVAEAVDVPEPVAVRALGLLR